MKALVIYIKFLTVIRVNVYRPIHGRYMRNSYTKPTPASVQRIARLVATHESTLSGEDGAVIRTFSF